MAELSTSRWGSRVLWVAGTLLAAALALIGAHLYAGAQYELSFSAVTPQQQRAAAAAAASIEPFNERFDVRADWLEGERLLAAGEYEAAYTLLRDTLARDIGNDALRESYDRATKAWSGYSGSKAHLQHGHEGPKGELAPEDVER